MKVKDLLYCPEKWLKKSFAKDENGRTCCSSSEAAACWCLTGAILKCYPTDTLEKYNRYCDIIDSVLEYIAPHTTIAVYNDLDSTSFEDIRKLVETLNI